MKDIKINLDPEKIEININLTINFPKFNFDGLIKKIKNKLCLFGDVQWKLRS